EGGVVVDHQALAAGPRTEDDADLGAVLVGQFEARIGQRLFRRRDPEMQARLAPARGLWVHPIGRSEVANLAGELCLVRGRVELGNRPKAGTPVDEAGPGRCDVVADRADDPETG